MLTGSNWQPSAALETLKKRARILQGIRAFFDARGVLEVQTPLLSRAATTDVQLASYQVDTDAGPRFLHTSPELPMKRLLAVGFGDCYQIAPVFRPGEAGRHHNSEFTLLEWYRRGFSIDELIDETAALIHHLHGQPLPLEQLRYAEAFERQLGLCPLEASDAEIQSLLERTGLWSGEREALPRDSALDLLFSEAVACHFPDDRLTAISHYPASQAALAQIDPGDPRTARRSELYWGPLELANGFQELADPAEQRRRFEADNQQRRELGLPEQPVDEHFLQALEQGHFPECAGIALGVDRLIMQITGARHIGEVIAFDTHRA
ncbi:MAG: EF-P lysine aminoacylase EpmA [Pseudomonadota bacterium]